ncbi:PREDICTED: calcium-activated chloride channel regulator 4-like [Chrysochloris asiatica]|uniref:Calcium-activated chloride channel regulator 4-like n=1 Tax=Chrysochloris asiatica TaxID=185453 RepID=A0A9B0SY26_CHRAS|nr:PREDICTED: calcium-activated chloride channel regulator 4-like [Chrysochloris asiatica]
MGLFRSSLYLLILCLLQGSNTSLIQLNNNGYEDIIIAINPLVPEDETLIEQIKDMVTSASTYLFEATEKRFFFKNVSILIPENWKENPQYKRPKHENYKHADVLVAPPTFPGRDQPYTRHFAACEEKGKYIHFTPDFVRGKKQNEYGPTGRVFVHEWAHLRWGVFDEYNEDEPFYSSKSKKIEATRCSTGISGMNKVYHCQQGNCIYKNCRIDPQTNLYTKDCQFFPNKVQKEKASIMFMQSIYSIVEFCNAKNHNREAPSLQNKKCNSRSTWEVISNSEDFKNSMPMVESPPPTAFSLMRTSHRVVCLVLDKSENMASFNRLNRMNQAAKHFLLQTIENGSWVGIVAFDSTAHIKSKLTHITGSNERIKLSESLPTEASGGISICSGVKTAFQVIREKFPQIDGSEIILLIAGEDNTVRNCMEEVIQSGAIIHLIAIGPSSEPAVIEMSSMTGGTHHYVSDQVQNNGFMSAFGSLTSGNIDLSQQTLQLESKGLTLTKDPWMNGTVIIDSTVGKDTFFFVTWDKQPPRISLWDPNGRQMGEFTEDKDSKMAYLTIPGFAKVGIWTYSLQAKVNPETLTVTVTSQVVNSVPPIIVNAKMNKDTNSFPAPVIVYAEIQQGYLPVLGVNVTAFIESKSGETEVLDLLDNGAGADSFKNDGVYSRYFTTYKENGRYSLKVQAQGGANIVTRSSQRPRNGALSIPGWTVDGKIEGKPSRSEINEDTQTTLESFSRTVSGGEFVVSNIPKFPLSDVYPPSQITDLDAKPDGDQITLTWTAPGDNFDVGKVQRYVLRISESILALRDNFDTALPVTITDLLPKEANSKETFVFTPGKILEENVTRIFIAIKSVDKSNLTSKISNIVQVPLFIPQADPSLEENRHNTRVNISILVLSVTGSVVVVSIILSTTIYILKKKKNESRPATSSIHDGVSDFKMDSIAEASGVLHITGFAPALKTG